MKQKLLFALAALGAVTVSSCSNDDDFENFTSGNTLKSREITFSDPFVKKATTRALVDNSNIKDQTLRVWGEMANMGTESWLNVFNGTELSYVDGVWKPVTPAYWYEYKDYRFTAVHPASAPFSYADGKIALADVPVVQPVNTATDYMVSDQFTTTTNSQERELINLTMTHMMSKLTFLVKRTGDYDVRINSSKVWLPKEDVTASYQADSVNINRTDASCWTYVSTFDNNAVVPSDDYNAYTCYADDILLSDDAIAGASYLIAPHNSLSMFIDLDFDILDSEGNILRNSKISKRAVKRENMKMLSNSSYGITVNIKANSYADTIEFGEFTVNDWDSFSDVTNVESYTVRFTTTGSGYFCVDGTNHFIEENATSFTTVDKPKRFIPSEVINNSIQGNEAITSIDFAGMDLSLTKNWANTFYGCKNLKSVRNLTPWLKNVQLTGIQGLFINCSSLTYIDDLSDLDISKCKSLRTMFYKCQRLPSVGNLRGWDTSNVTTLDGMFSHCNSLTEVNLNGWNTSNVTSMVWMFDMADAGDKKIHSTWSKLERIDLGGWDTRNVKNFSFCFQDCDMLQELILDGWTITEEVVNTPDDDGTSRLRGMFSGVNKTVTIYARGCDDFTIQTLRSVMPTEATLITE